MSATRLDGLEEKINVISTDQAVIKSEITGIGEVLSTLVELRSESLYLIKQQKSDRKEHNEMFSRLRIIESAKASCMTERASLKKDIEKLEKNQRWGVIAFISAAASLVTSLLIYWMKAKLVGTL